MYKWVIKPIFDFLFALTGIVFLMPIFLVLCVAIKLDSRGSIFFRQKRVGRNKKLFYIYKFRTMRVDTPKDMPTHMLDNADSYITRVGRFLRRTSLDELPQLFNILFGSMSIIGPRPALYNQDDLIMARDAVGANSIRPGLTGLAQISGRDELAIDVKAGLDGEYAKKIGIFMDIKIFFRTIFKVFSSEGVVEGKKGSGAVAQDEQEVADGAHEDSILDSGEAEI